MILVQCVLGKISGFDKMFIIDYLFIWNFNQRYIIWLLGIDKKLFCNFYRNLHVNHIYR